ncbi:MAG TPA: hypothetical protein VN033_02520 [Vulgatibacter sp.]|nr:hypothetical protein [Vulgatibacter sp.]
MDLNGALVAADELAALLEREIWSAIEHRRHLQSFHAERLFSWARARAQFQADAEGCQERLFSALSAVARSRGLETLSLDELAAVAPEDAERLSSQLTRLRALAADLAWHDQLNRSLGERTREIARSYLEALAPRAAAYDRQGRAAPLPSSSRNRIR